MKTATQTKSKPVTEPLAVPYSTAMARLSVAEGKLRKMVKEGLLTTVRVKKPGAKRAQDMITIESIMQFRQSQIGQSQNKK